MTPDPWARILWASGLAVSPASPTPKSLSSARPLELLALKQVSLSPYLSNLKSATGLALTNTVVLNLWPVGPEGPFRESKM